MRYYKIEVIDTDGTTPIISYTSHPKGVNSPPDPGALNIELDMPVVYLTPGEVNDPVSQSGDVGGSHLRIWGIPLSEISQATDWTFKNIKISGGMGKGLPLADPSLSGVLAEGLIARSFGNWIGVNMTHDFILTAGTNINPNKPVNITWKWAKGQQLKEALDQALKTAYPAFDRDIRVSDKLIRQYDDPGFAGTINQLAGYLLGTSKEVVGGKYDGVRLSIQGNKIIATDQSQDAAKTTDIGYNELIGQPTWIDVGIIQVTLVMRAGIAVGEKITLPKTQATTQAPAALMKSSAIFQGEYWVTQVRHVGNYKQPDAGAWVTVVTAIAEQSLQTVEFPAF